MMEKIKETTEQLLEEEYFDIGDLGEDEKFEVLLVGGSTRLLCVREWLQERF